MMHNQSLHRSWLAFWFFNVVSFVQRFRFFEVHSYCSASPVNLVVIRHQPRERTVYCRVHGFSLRRADVEALGNSFVRRAEVKRQHELVDEFTHEWMHRDSCASPTSS